MTTEDIRREFLEFFRARGHQVVPSDSIVPRGDPTLLFTGAGMNQFKAYFLGERRDLRRAASCQKCLRTLDLDQVGRTPSHHTFFEMLGNFSFGDYFKEEAITWAWELLTRRFGIAADRLAVSVHRSDEEAQRVWRERIGVPAARVAVLGDQENFWPANAIVEGPNGPCGPCSEIYLDRGPEVGCGRPTCGVTCDCGRFFEVWNLVFTQFNRLDGGRLEPLPQRNIDTGMGLERLARALQGVASNYETDGFRPMVEAILAEAKAGSPRPAIYAIADHARAVVVLLADGVLPANDGRGYVVRALIRRAARLGRSVNLRPGALARLVPVVQGELGAVYPEIAARAAVAGRVIQAEEDRYAQTLREGRPLLAQLIAEAGRGARGTLSGEAAFKLYDTYGLPLEVIEEESRAAGLTVDQRGFETALAEQRRRSQAGSAMGGEVFSRVAQALSAVAVPSQFLGYDTTEAEGSIVALVEDERGVAELRAPAAVGVVLDRTPFYAEAGGQVGDRGVLEGAEGTVEVSDAQWVGTVILHVGTLVRGTLRQGDRLRARVDRERRDRIARNHTATHLLHAALRQVLGDHVQQSGSVVRSDGLRFDFTHPRPVSPEDLAQVEGEVRRRIAADDVVTKVEMDVDEARAQGAIALFGETYGARVRVVTVGAYSKELCGGTHVGRAGEIGAFRIVGEASIAAGMRRIEALTSAGAEAAQQEARASLVEVAASLGSSPDELERVLPHWRERLRRADQRLRQGERRVAKHLADHLRSQVRRAGDRSWVASSVAHGTPGLRRAVADVLKGELGSCVVVLMTPGEGQAAVTVAVSRDLAAHGVAAGRLLQAFLGVMGGSGGGSPTLAEGGGADPAKFATACESLPRLMAGPAARGGASP